MKSFSLTLLLLVVCASSHAAIFSETSVSYLNGSHYEVGNNPHRTIITYEHASAWKYGDNFFFIDVTNPLSRTNSNNTTIYGEWSPRFSIGKVLGFYKKDRFIQDILLSTTLEHGNSGRVTRALLYGLGFDLAIPYFTFFKYNFYIRNNPDKTGATFQSTLVWKVPLQYKELKFIFTGYFDYVHGTEGSRVDNTLVEAHINAAPQFLFDVGNLYRCPDTLYLGVEYQYWGRKFGLVSAPVENNLQVILKWIL